MLGKSFLKTALIFSFLFLASWALAALTPSTIDCPKTSDSPIYAGEIEFKWSNTGANFYKYHINLPDGTAEEETIKGSSIKIYDLKLGSHSWAVYSCNDSEGKDCSSQSAVENFEIISAPSHLLGGLVPCGRQYDNPATEINEAKPCQLTDIFVLLKLLLDFLLWRLGLIILVLLTIFTGVTIYFSFGGPGTIVKVKSILRSAFAGYLLIFLAWLFVNLILKLLGYTLQWWIIPF